MIFGDLQESNEFMNWYIQNYKNIQKLNKKLSTKRTSEKIYTK